MSQVYIGNGSGGGGPTTDLHVARFIVSAGGTADGANYTTIAAAYAAAVAAGGNQTVFIQPGTYSIGTQALSANVNISAFSCDSTTPNVTLSGKLTASYSGSVSISGVNLQTNGDYCLVVSGANETRIFFDSAVFTATDHDMIQITNSNSASIVFINDSDFFGGSFQAFTNTSVCNLDIFDSDIGGAIASTISGTTVQINNSQIPTSITTSSAGGLQVTNCFVSGILTFNGTAISSINNSNVVSTLATAINIGAAATIVMTDCSVQCNQTNAIGGTGTLNTTPISFTGSSSGIQNTLTVNSLPFLPAPAASISITGDSGGALTGSSFTFTGGSTGLTFSGAGTTETLTGTNNVAHGGTGDTSFTAYSVICGGTTSTGPLQNVSGLGTAGQTLTSNGAGALPTWQTPGGGSAVAFLAYLSAPVPNATGNGADYHVAFDTVPIDTNSAFTTGASAHFTAPTTGLYFFSAQVNTFLNANSASDTIVTIVATSRSVQSQFFVGSAFSSSLTSNPLSAVIDMTAGDTVFVNVNISGTGANTCQIQGSGSPYETYFSGFKIA